MLSLEMFSSWVGVGVGLGLGLGLESGLGLGLERFSSSMLPPLERFSVAPLPRFLKVPSGGPPVPARELLGSLACGQPNWFMKPGMTRWKWTPS